MSDHGLRAATATEDHKLQIWELPSGRLLQELAVCCPPAPPVLHSNCFCYNLHLRHPGKFAPFKCSPYTEKVTLCSPLQGHGDEVTGIEFSPDSSLLASCSRDCSLRVWQVASGVHIRKLLAMP